jgi:hypothetical protein
MTSDEVEVEAGLKGNECPETLDLLLGPPPHRFESGLKSLR